MNIFFLSRNPTEAAQLQCDKHVVKMCLETTQLLWTAHQFYGISEEVSTRINTSGITPYKPTHVNHPCAIWSRSYSSNYSWLWEHLHGLCQEFYHRFSKEHACKQHLFALQLFPQFPSMDCFNAIDVSPAPQCMPDKYKRAFDPVCAYWNYYRYEKAHLCKYTNRDVPKFMEGFVCSK